MSTFPDHIGFIADGNRRWAKERGLPTLEGHRRGSEVAEMIVDYFKTTTVKFVTFFVFSTENWSRSDEEVNYLMNMMAEAIKKFRKKAERDNLRIIILGRSARIDPKLWQKLMTFEDETKDNTGLTVCFCFNYGGQWEIADAATKAIAAGERELSPETFAKYLYHPEVPNVDLVVRTSGEERSSGFMLWRAAYSEYLFLPQYFPTLKESDLEKILNEYADRQRRFGK